MNYCHLCNSPLEPWYYKSYDAICGGTYGVTSICSNPNCAERKRVVEMLDEERRRQQELTRRIWQKGE